MTRCPVNYDAANIVTFMMAFATGSEDIRMYVCMCKVCWLGNEDFLGKGGGCQGKRAK